MYLLFFILGKSRSVSICEFDIWKFDGEILTLNMNVAVYIAFLQVNSWNIEPAEIHLACYG
jgi:hypothetical protein